MYRIKLGNLTLCEFLGCIAFRSIEDKFKELSGRYPTCTHTTRDEAQMCIGLIKAIYLLGGIKPPELTIHDGKCHNAP